MSTFAKTTALVVVDVQNDFADPAGSLAVAGAERVVERVNRLVAEALEAGATVVYTQDWHPESTPHFAKDGGIWPVHCVGGSWGAELHHGLLVAGELVRKGQNGEDGYSGFTMRDPVSGDERPTELEGLLRRRDISSLVVCGLATDYCVKATALDGRRLGFDTAIQTDAIAAVDLAAGDGDRALAAMAASGVVMGD